MVEKLTKDQQKAFYGILQFIAQPIENYGSCATILYAVAGCGKSHLTRYIADVLRGKLNIAGVCPTHKARKVLDNMLNTDCFLTIKTMTVASLLNKMRNHSYIGTNHYKETGTNKLSLYDFFIVDEVSMITDEDVKKIISYAFQFKKKLLFVGDKYQIPNPSQEYVVDVDQGYAYKKDCVAFNIQGFELTTIVRQKLDNPLTTIYSEIRDAIAEKREANIYRETKLKDGMGVVFFTNKDEWYAKMAEIFRKTKVDFSPKDNKNKNNLIEDKKDNDLLDLHRVKVIAYTNDAVRTHNQKIRQVLQKGLKPERGDILVGCDNIGFPELILVNGQEYYVLEVKETKTYRILQFSGLVGLILQIKETDSNVESTLFAPEVEHRNNKNLLNELVVRADKVNKHHSTKQDYKEYCSLRNKMIFMENIYKYRGEIMGETQFRCNNPLLFKNISEVIDEKSKTILNNKLVKDIEEKYGSILEDRIADDKIFADVEKIGDRYCIIEKSLDFSYSITAHKSQGSTYHTVFIDEPDFDKMKSRYNYKLKCDVNATKEKNQLKYVSYTRPSQVAHVFFSEIIDN